MIGTSAGGHGVARNCDMMADKLKAVGKMFKELFLVLFMYLVCNQC